MPRSIRILLSTAALLAFGGTAAAEELNREEYVDRLEEICKPGALETQRVMKGARADLRAERLDPATKKFAKAGSIFDSTLSRIATVPRPEADRDRLAKWFTYLKRQSSYLDRITAQLHQGNAIKAQRLTARFIHSGNLANNVVLAFGFDWCRFKFSRYG